MTHEQRATALREQLEREAGEQLWGTVRYPEVEAVIASAIREAVATEKERVLATDQARFYANAQLPTTWEYDVIEDAKEVGALAEREACAKVADRQSARTAADPTSAPSEWLIAKDIAAAIRSRP